MNLSKARAEELAAAACDVIHEFLGARVFYSAQPKHDGASLRAGDRMNHAGQSLVVYQAGTGAIERIRYEDLLSMNPGEFVRKYFSTNLIDIAGVLNEQPFPIYTVDPPLPLGLASCGIAVVSGLALRFVAAYSVESDSITARCDVLFARQ